MKKWLVLILAFVLTFGLCACEKNEYRHDLTSAQVMERVLSALPSEQGYREVTEQYINTSTWGETCYELMDKVADYHIVVAQNSDENINEIGVFHVKDTGDMGALPAMVETFVVGQTLRYGDLRSSYNPRELPKLDEAEVKVCGTYVFYSILSDENTDRAQDAFEDAVSLK